MNKWSFKNLAFILPLLALILAPLSSWAVQDAKPFVGTWNGAISVGQELEITIEISLDAENNLQGNIDVPVQGAMDIPLGEFNVEGKKISFKIVHPQVQGDPTFSGELDDTGKKIAGEFSQGSSVGTFSVEKE